MGEWRTCKVRDSAFVDPCDGLMELTAGGNAYRGKGIIRTDLVNTKTGNAARTFYSIRSGQFADKAMIMNCCPICGERIDGPVADDVDRTDVEMFRPVKSN